MKKKSLLSLLFVILTINFVFAQDPPQLKEGFKMTPNFVNPFEKESKNWIPKTVDNPTNHAYNALHYKLQLDWYRSYSSPYNHDYKAIATLKFVADSILNSIQLDAADSSILVDSVKLSGVIFTQSNNILTINLDSTYHPTDTVSVLIYYTHKNTVDKAFHAEDGFVFTDCSPEKARNWFPCWDKPYDKATFEVNVKTKSGVKLCSNGALIDSLTVGDTLTYHWKSRDPLSTYIMANLSNQNFNCKQEYWKKPSNLLDSIPVLYYYNTGEDVDSLKFYMTDMMNYFSLLYGEYPFEKLAWATLNSDFPWAGMENQTIISLYPNGWNDKNTTSHEFAHHWWGDLITHSTWSDIFLKEGFPQYSVCLWFEHLYGRQGYISKVLEFSNYYLQNNTERAIYIPSWATTTPAPDVLFDYAVTYCKSACVIHMLRGIVGDIAFFNILKSFATDPAFTFKTAYVSDFKNKVNSITGTDYSWFFDQWLNNPNHPIYNNSYVISNNAPNWTVDYTVNQTQTNAPFFKMPIDVEITFTDLSDTVVRFMNDQNNQTFTFVFNKEPKTIVFDPFTKILPKIETATPKCTGLKTFTAVSDTIEDGSALGNYGNNSVCLWNITPSNNPSSINLHFINFDTEENNDTLVIFDNNINPIQRLAVVSGRITPSDVICNTSKIKMKFVTNKYITRQGWTISYTGITNVNNYGDINLFALYPNPAKNSVTLDLKLERKDNVEINFVNLLGQIVYTESFNYVDDIHTNIDVSNLRSGVYFINVNTSKGTLQKKFVKD
ncbi:MAG: M1 family aminopeptidase [Bacteroidota bacterium]